MAARAARALRAGRAVAAPGAPDARAAAGRPLSDGAGTSSSRTDARAAGWEREGEEPGSYVVRLARRVDPRYLHFFWLRPRTLLESRNDFLGRRVGDMVDDERMRWVAAQRAAGVEERFPDFVIDRTDLREPRFLVVGDPGEADASQYAVVEPLLAVGRDTDFMVIASDVIYPAGDVNDYVNAFYIPYAEYPRTIYALPGNHDWYALLNGFMFNFCGAEALPPTNYHPFSYPPAERRARRAWRASSRPKRALLLDYRAARPPWRDERRAAQPGPYWALDAGPIRLVAIDTGVAGQLDHEQGEWLRRVSRGPRPKVLLTGKPIYANNAYDAGRIAWSPGREPVTVDDIVRAPEHGYVAAIGGDVHNYQRYPVSVDGRTIQYVVAGGGGAFMNATHSIGRVEVAGVGEDEFRCYPLRGDSLARYSRVLAPRLRRALVGLVALLAVSLAAAYALPSAGGPRWLADALEVLPVATAILGLAGSLYLTAVYFWIIAFGGVVDVDTAARYVGDLLEVPPTRVAARDVPIPFVTERKLRAMLPGPGRERRLLKGKLFGAFFDFDEPPFFKSFLRLEVRGDVLRISCFGVTGWKRDEHDPWLEDLVEIPLGAAAADG